MWLSHVSTNFFNQTVRPGVDNSSFQVEYITSSLSSVSVSARHSKAGLHTNLILLPDNGKVIDRYDVTKIYEGSRYANGEQR